MDKHDLVVSVKKVARDLRHVPRLAQFIRHSDLKNPRRLLEDLYKKAGYDGLLRDAKLEKIKKSNTYEKVKIKTPNILFIDLESAAMLVWLFGMRNQNPGINQIHQHGHMLSFAAKLWKKNKIYYFDQSKKNKLNDDAGLVRRLERLFKKADFIVAHYGDGYDIKVTNAQAIVNNLKRPTKCQTIDTYKVAKANFHFPSYKLEYLAQRLCKKHKKYKSRKYVGMELWNACMARDPKAWAEMKFYNIKDILVLEELFERLIPYIKNANFNMYHDSNLMTCNCGCQEFSRGGTYSTGSGKFQKYFCKDCNAPFKAPFNDASLRKRDKMLRRL